MMIRKLNIAGAIVAGLSIAGAAGIAVAQQTSVPQAPPSILSIALADGTVGEQADGYLGIRGVTVTPALRAEVDALRIKRRELYTQLAVKKGVTIQDAAAAVGCETLATRVGIGRAYKLPDGIWRVRKVGEVIDLPPYCGT
jgi:uncharacterized protein